MASTASILLSVTVGCLVVYRFAGLTAFHPRWAAWLLILGVGASIGAGITSCLFLLASTIPGVPHVALWIHLALLAGTAYECWRRRLPAPGESVVRYPHTPALWLVWVMALLFAAFAMTAVWRANPHGNWDAWAIWNLRAKFLAAGYGLMSRAWSPQLASTHPEYPLLLTGFVASCWSDAGSISTDAPVATSGMFFLALLVTVTGGMAALRGPVIGLLAGICLMVVPPLLREAPSQYADVPLACFLAGAVVLTLLDRPVFAGLMAGCAACTKDEGILLALSVLAAIVILHRSRAIRYCLAAAPFFGLILSFKFFMLRGTHSLLGDAQAGLTHRLTDFGWYVTVAAAMAHELARWNIGWYQPILPIAVLLLGLGLDRQNLRKVAFCGVVALAALLGYFEVYLVTPNDLPWQLQTSLTRLFVQICPVVLIMFFVAMRSPPPIAPIQSPPKAEANVCRGRGEPDPLPGRRLSTPSAMWRRPSCLPRRRSCRRLPCLSGESDLGASASGSRLKVQGVQGS